MNFTRPEKEKNTSRFNTNLLNMLPFRNARSIVATTESVDMDRKTEMLKILRELELVDDESTFVDIVLYAQQDISQISMGATLIFVDGSVSNLSIERSNDFVEPNYTCNKFMVQGDKKVLLDHSNLYMGTEVDDYEMSEAVTKIYDCLITYGEPLDANISPIIR